MKRVLAILTFIAMAFGLAWLIALPLWMNGGLNSPLFLPISIAIMFTPAVTAVIVGKLFEPQVRLVTALGIAPVRGRVGAIVLYSLLGIVVALVMTLGGLFVGQAFGVFQLDLVHFSAFRELIVSKLNGKPLPATMPPLRVLVLVQLAVVIIASPINALAAIGEEIGWRGWLLPRLEPMGIVPAIVVSGVIWGLWHAPLILLGYNYPGAPAWQALGCMSAMCTVAGIFLAWLRWRSVSVLPCAVAHGAINASAGFYVILGAAGQTVDVTQATLLGWTGWLLPAAIGILLFVLFPVGKDVNQNPGLRHDL